MSKGFLSWTFSKLFASHVYSRILRCLLWLPCGVWQNKEWIDMRSEWTYELCYRTIISHICPVPQNKRKFSTKVENNTPSWHYRKVAPGKQNREGVQCRHGIHVKILNPGRGATRTLMIHTCGNDKDAIIFGDDKSHTSLKQVFQVGFIRLLPSQCLE